MLAFRGQQLCRVCWRRSTAVQLNHGLLAPCLLSAPNAALRHAAAVMTTTTTAATAASPAQAGSASSGFSAPQASSTQSSPPPKEYEALRNLYKSTHHGSGTTPMPKPVSEKRLKQRSKADVEALLGSRSSCSEDQGPVPERALTPLQRRQLLFKNKAAFVLAPAGLRRVKFLLAQYRKNHPDATGAAPTGIRIGVRRRGCSGYSYTVNYYFAPHEGDNKDADTTVGASVASLMTATSAPAGKANKTSGLLDFLKKDVVVEQDDVKVVVDADALFYVIGTEMDYVVRNVEEKFTFANPNQKFSCGCEESFMPFDEDDLDD